MFAASMESIISIKLKVLSCKGVKAFNFFQKLITYVLVSLVGDDPDKKVEHSQEQRTATDTEGDGNPEWNHEMQFDLDPNVSVRDYDHLFLKFDLRHEGALFGDKPLGEVHVPLKDLIQQPNGIVRFVSYEVRSTDGKPNGVLNFSYQVTGKGMHMETDSPPSNITGFPLLYPALPPEDQYPLWEGRNTASTHLLHSSPEYQSTYSSPGNLYPTLSPLDTYYPPPLMYPPLLPPPPHPHMAGGECYPSHGPSQVYPWRPQHYPGVYGYNDFAPESQITGHQHHQHGYNDGHSG